MAKTISASVGLGGANRNGDVTTIQGLLNRVPPAQGGPTVQLGVDGACGPATVAAIRAFQQKQTGFADGRVDPNGGTMTKLNQFDGAGPAPGAPPAAAPVTGLRKKIIDVATAMATPAPGKVSDLVTTVEPGTGRTIRAGWAQLKDIFDVAVTGWQPSYWNNPDYINGVKVPGKRIPQPGKDGVSWCGIFAAYVLIKSGMNVKWVLGAGISPLKAVGDTGFRPGDVLVMKGPGVHHCIAISDEGTSMQTVNGNSDWQSILVKPIQKSQVAYHYKVES